MFSLQSDHPRIFRRFLALSRGQTFCEKAALAELLLHSTGIPGKRSSARPSRESSGSSPCPRTFLSRRAQAREQIRGHRCDLLSNRDHAQSFRLGSYTRRMAEDLRLVSQKMDCGRLGCAQCERALILPVDGFRPMSRTVSTNKRRVAECCERVG